VVVSEGAVRKAFTPARVSPVALLENWNRQYSLKSEKTGSFHQFLAVLVIQSRRSQLFQDEYRTNITRFSRASVI
jgi:hypothetical protein